MIQQLRRFLYDSHLPLWTYCLLALPVALLPSVLFAATAYWGLTALGVDVDALKPPETSLSKMDLLGAIVLAPVAETFCLAGILALLSILGTRASYVALASALVWGALHGAFGAMWFFGTAWSFYVFSCAYLYWRKQSFGKAFVAASVPHALVNSSVMLVLALASVG